MNDRNLQFWIGSCANHGPTIKLQFEYNLYYIFVYGDEGEWLAFPFSLDAAGQPVRKSIDGLSLIGAIWMLETQLSVENNVLERHKNTSKEAFQEIYMHNGLIFTVLEMLKDYNATTDLKTIANAMQATMRVSPNQILGRAMRMAGFGEHQIPYYENIQNQTCEFVEIPEKETGR